MAKRKTKTSKKKIGGTRTKARAKTTAKSTAKSRTKKVSKTKRSAKKTTTRKSAPKAKAKRATTTTKAKSKAKTKSTKSRAAKPKAKTKSAVTNRAKSRLAGNNPGGNNSAVASKTPARPRGRRLSPQDMDSFRQLLLDKRAELVGDVSNLRREALGGNHSESDGHSSNMPTHMADLGTDNWEQEFTLGLLDKDMALLKEIDDALGRIADGSYGRCLATEHMIAKARLRAKPWAKYCIEYAEQLERGLVPRDDD